MQYIKDLELFIKDQYTKTENSVKDNRGTNSSSSEDEEVFGFENSMQRVPMDFKL